MAPKLEALAHNPVLQTPGDMTFPHIPPNNTLETYKPPALHLLKAAHFANLAPSETDTPRTPTEQARMRSHNMKKTRGGTPAHDCPPHHPLYHCSSSSNHTGVSHNSFALAPLAPSAKDNCLPAGTNAHHRRLPACLRSSMPMPDPKRKVLLPFLTPGSAPPVTPAIPEESIGSGSLLADKVCVQAPAHQQPLSLDCCRTHAHLWILCHIHC
jgi:hypothetical protein